MQTNRVCKYLQKQHRSSLEGLFWTVIALIFLKSLKTPTKKFVVKATK